MRLADHHRRHVGGRERGNLAAAGLLAAAEHGHLIGKRPHFFEFVRDDDDGELSGICQTSHEVEHVLRFLRGQGRGRLIEHKQSALEIKLLEDFRLLPLACSKRAERNIQRNFERHARQEVIEALPLCLPIDDKRHVGARHHQIFGGGHRRYQREMLVDHAETETIGVLRLSDAFLSVADDEIAGIGAVIAEQAFDEGRFAGAVLAEQRVHRASLNLQRHVIEGRERTKPLRHARRFDADRAHFRAPREARVNRRPRRTRRPASSPS